MADRYVQALSTYADQTRDLTQRIMQDRTLHAHNLNEVYVQALAGGEHPGFISAIEQAIGERSLYNERKLVLDAGDLTVHDQKIQQALGHNSGALSGGGVVDTSRSALSGMEYAARRSNALHASFNQKLAQDRQVHAQELAALYSAAPNGPAKAVLSSMVSARTMDNQSRTMHDANMWAQMDSEVGSLLGGGSTARRVLSYGVNGAPARRPMRGGAGGVLDDICGRQPGSEKVVGGTVGG